MNKLSEHNHLERMNASLEHQNISLELEETTVDELLKKACSYGRVRLHQHDDGKWSCTIKFETDSGISLEAKSQFDHKSPHEALALAIQRAKKIKDQFK